MSLIVRKKTRGAGILLLSLGSFCLAALAGIWIGQADGAIGLPLALFSSSVLGGCIVLFINCWWTRVLEIRFEAERIMERRAHRELVFDPRAIVAVDYGRRMFLGGKFRRVISFVDFRFADGNKYSVDSEFMENRIDELLTWLRATLHIDDLMRETTRTDKKGRIL